MQDANGKPETTATECPYQPDTREAAAYWIGRDAEIPPPQIVMDDALSAAWDKGMDDREAIREKERVNG